MSCSVAAVPGQTTCSASGAVPAQAVPITQAPGPWARPNRLAARACRCTRPGHSRRLRPGSLCSSATRAACPPHTAPVPLSTHLHHTAPPVAPARPPAAPPPSTLPTTPFVPSPLPPATYISPATLRPLHHHAHVHCLCRCCCCCRRHPRAPCCRSARPRRPCPSLRDPPPRKGCLDRQHDPHRPWPRRHIQSGQQLHRASSLHPLPCIPVQRARRTDTRCADQLDA